MKSNSNLFKTALLALVLGFGVLGLQAQKVTGDQSGKIDVKGDQNGTGKNIVKDGGTVQGGGKVQGTGTDGKGIVKGNGTNPKDDIKNGTNGQGGADGSTATGGQTTGGSQGGTGAGKVEPGMGLSTNGSRLAYTRDQSMEGKAYDQARLDAARARCQSMFATAEALIAAEEQHILDAKAKIQSSNEVLTHLNSNKKSDKAAIANLESLIMQANDWVAALERDVNAGKAALAKAKALLNPAS